VYSRQKGPTTVPPSAPDAVHDHRIRHLQHGMGIPSRPPPNGGEMGPGGGQTPHKLSGTTSCISSSSVLCQAQQRGYNSDEVGQCHSCDIHQQVGGNALPDTLPACIEDVGLVHSERCLFGSRTSARQRQYNSRSRISINKGSLRLAWILNPQIFSQIQRQMGPLQIDLFASWLTKQLPNFYSWRPDPEAIAVDAFNQDWASDEGICQPSVVLDSTLSQIKRQMARVVMITPLWASQPWYPTILGMLEDYPRILPGNEDLVILPTGQEFIMSQGAPELVAWPISGNPSHHEEASALLLASWRPKTQSNYNSLFSKWACWCSQSNRDPTVGPVEDVINFLAELFKDGYRYQSLNLYRSAISALHSKVDGYLVGQHPLITRMLKGVFNERPPVAKYSTFWDVGMVLRYFKGLGENASLSLCLLTMKSVMLLTLTRPARSVNWTFELAPSRQKVLLSRLNACLSRAEHQSPWQISFIWGSNDLPSDNTTGIWSQNKRVQSK